MLQVPTFVLCKMQALTYFHGSASLMLRQPPAPAAAWQRNCEQPGLSSCNCPSVPQPILAIAAHQTLDSYQVASIGGGSSVAIRVVVRAGQAELASCWHRLEANLVKTNQFNLFFTFLLSCTSMGSRSSSLHMDTYLVACADYSGREASSEGESAPDLFKACQGPSSLCAYSC